MPGIKDEIESAYNGIAAFASANGPARQRDLICTGLLNDIKKRYPDYKGYIEEADAGLSCGLPFEFIRDLKGKAIAVLGCASGLNVFSM